MRRSRSVIRSLAVVAMGLVLAGGLAQATTPAMRASCDGGVVYSWAVSHARGAVVGRVASTATDEFGFPWVTSVRVERASGLAPGSLYRGRIGIGMCSTDEPRVGARVVVLVDVPGAVPGQPPSDLFYTLGRTVTPWQAAHVFADLPDTAMAAPRRPGGPLRPWGVPALAGILALGLVLARPPRRARRPSS